MRRPKYTVEQLIEAVRVSTSMRQVLTRLYVAPYGGNYDVLRNKLKTLRIDTSHFTGRAWSRNRQLPVRTPLQHYFDGLQPVQSYKLKHRLLRAGLLTPECTGCRLQLWLGQPIPLELDHINGNNKDNRLENLRLLCPNCHALTPTYRSKRRS
jgi:5-methylcytosine-specific restriction endonuclease McrA